MVCVSVLVCIHIHTYLHAYIHTYLYIVYKYTQWIFSKDCACVVQYCENVYNMYNQVVSKLATRCSQCHWLPLKKGTVCIPAHRKLNPIYRQARRRYHNHCHTELFTLWIHVFRKGTRTCYTPTVDIFTADILNLPVYPSFSTFPEFINIITSSIIARQDRYTAGCKLTHDDDDENEMVYTKFS